MIFGFGGGSATAEGLLVRPDQLPDADQDSPAGKAGEIESVVLGGGCFWCVEAVYRMLDGVTGAVSGYAGGAAETANYKAVCRGDSGHAEVVRVDYDPSRISLGRILKIFFAISHDPTQLNRQGNDVGTQYRSVIFCRDEAQRKLAESYIAQLNGAGVFSGPIVTEVAMLDAFHEAEDYHQDYAAQNPTQPYIACISAPKVAKLREYFPAILKG